MTARPPVHAALLLAPLLIATSCSPAIPAGAPVVPACEAAANDDPAVKLLINKSLGNMHFQLENDETLRATKQDAYNRCLRERGLQRRGGVERQKSD